VFQYELGRIWVVCFIEDIFDVLCFIKDIYNVYCWNI